jgi:hypothetical protein
VLTDQAQVVDRRTSGLKSAELIDAVPAALPRA